MEGRTGDRRANFEISVAMQRPSRADSHEREAELPIHECPLDDIVSGFADMSGDFEASRIEDTTGVSQHRGTAADHHAIVLRIKHRQTQVAE